jgi:hypothetical protein
MRKFKMSPFTVAKSFQLEDAANELEPSFLQEAERVIWPATREDTNGCSYEGQASGGQLGGRAHATRLVDTRQGGRARLVRDAPTCVLPTVNNEGRD